MSYHGEWLIPLRVIHVKVSGVVTPAELDIHTETIAKLLSEAQAHDPKRMIHLLMDAGEVESFPMFYLMVPTAMPVLRFQNRGTMFFVTSSQKLKSIINLSAHIMRFSHRTFSTREEALEALEVAIARDDLKISS